MLNVVIFSTAPCLDVSSCDDAKLYNLSCLNIALYIPTINITVAATFYGLLFCCAQKQLLFYFFYEGHSLARAVTVNKPSVVEGELGFHWDELEVRLNDYLLGRLGEHPILSPE